MFKQVYVHVENKPGRVHAVMETIAEAKVNARALNVADDGDGGIIRLIVDDPQKAVDALRKNDFTAKLTDVIGFEVPDEAGGLCNVMRIFGERGVNIKYSYSILGAEQGKAGIVIRVNDDDYDKAKTILSEMAEIGVKLL